jgi:hypothetical protein
LSTKEEQEAYWMESLIISDPELKKQFQHCREEMQKLLDMLNVRSGKKGIICPSISIDVYLEEKQNSAGPITVQ